MLAFADNDYDIMSDLELNPIEDHEADYYSPFTSKAQALLFFLVHSPRPMVLDCVAIDMYCF